MNDLASGGLNAGDVTSTTIADGSITDLYMPKR